MAISVKTITEGIGQQIRLERDTNQTKGATTAENIPPESVASLLTWRHLGIMGQDISPQEAPRQLAPRIESDPDILGGKPVIAGSRLSLETILENLASGDTYEDVLDSYPFLTYEDIYAALGYAAQVLSTPASGREPAAS